MTNLVNVTYDQTGKSKSINALGMREMQEKAYKQRDAHYLLLKAPPAFGIREVNVTLIIGKGQVALVNKIVDHFS